MREFFSNPYHKGQYEYLNARKTQQMRFTLCCAFLVLAFVLSGLLIYHTQKNILTVPGVLMVLPAANFLVTYLALAKGKPLAPGKREALKIYEDNGLTLFHLMYVDEKGKRFFLEHVLVYHNAIVAFAPSLKGDQRVPLESDCIMRLRKKGMNLRLKLYTDWKDYCERVKEIPPEVPEDKVQLVERAQSLMLDMCL